MNGLSYTLRGRSAPENWTTMVSHSVSCGYAKGLIAPNKKASIGRNALTNDPVARQSAASPLDRRKRLAWQAQGAR
jgi:hypothetical protein